MLDSFKDSGSLAVDSTYSSVRGRLRKFVDFWRTLEVSQFVLNIIMQGYKIPFFQLPTPFVREKMLLLVSIVMLFRKLSAIYFVWT